MNTQTYAPGQRVDWLYKPIARRQYVQPAVVVEQDGERVAIRVWGVDGSYVRRVNVDTIQAEQKRVAA